MILFLYYVKFLLKISVRRIELLNLHVQNILNGFSSVRSIFSKSSCLSIKIGKYSFSTSTLTPSFYFDSCLLITQLPISILTTRISLKLDIYDLKIKFNITALGKYYIPDYRIFCDDICIYENRDLNICRYLFKI